MAPLKCPRCHAEVPTSEGWASAAVTLTIPAPAVPDMATQVRCPNCQHLFAASEVRHQTPPYLNARTLLLLVLLIAALTWLLA